jgi:hypothetical protein
MHWLSQRDCLADERLWKIYWWGGHRDEILLRRLETFSRLGQLSKVVHKATVVCRQGFTESKQERKPSPDWFLKYKELPADKLVSYGPLQSSWLVPVPAAVKRAGNEAVYNGTRLLIGRGVGQATITARLETQPFAFRNSVNAFRLEGLEPWQEKTLLGICWSSLARYYFFTTIGSWLWHDEIHRTNVVELPISFPRAKAGQESITRIVDELQGIDLQITPLEHGNIDHQHRAQALENELDEAIFDVFEMNAAERDLVREMCSIGLDMFYRHQKSDALREVVQPQQSSGLLSDIDPAEPGFGDYLRTFLDIWNKELAPDGEFAWRVLSPPSRAPLLAVSFTTRFKNDNSSHSPDSDTEAWSRALAHFQQHSLAQAGSSRVFIDTFFRYVSNREIIFIKRNERRFWTRTAAREDAESALTHLMNLEEVAPGGEG